MLASAMTKFTRLIESIPVSIPFVGPETLARKSGVPIVARLGANENVFGPSSKVIAALQAHAQNAWQYGDPELHDLKQALARHLGVAPENIAISEGIDGLHGLTVRMFVEVGDKVVYTAGAYPTFGVHVKSFGGNLITAPYVDDREDLAALTRLAKVERPKLLALVNPDNPMGTWWPASEIQKLIEEVPEETLVLLDEAYSEFAPVGTVLPIDVTRKNLLRFRTFSKAYGLAGMRIGYVIGHADLIASYDKVRNHFGVTRLSQVAALAALEDQDYMRHVVSEVAAARERLYEIARANGHTPLASATNFVTIDCGRDGAYAKAIVEGLLQHGIFIRMPGLAPQNRCIRISAGTKQNLDLLAEVLPVVLKSLHNSSPPR
jgi:histidinol-phosphate aminotransferase